MDEEYRYKMASLCAEARSIVAITGAGISAGSGLPTIQSGFHGRDLKEAFQLKNVVRHQQEYQRFYVEMERWTDASPNAAHVALARRQARVITQNMDGLHQRAGSRHVIELHGTLTRVRCLSCKKIMPTRIRLIEHPHCTLCGGMLWPDVVFEGEQVRHLSKAINWVSIADILLIIGTKLEMNPVNRLPMIGMRKGVPVIVVNQDAKELIPHILAVK